MRLRDRRVYPEKLRNVSFSTSRSRSLPPTQCICEFILGSDAIFNPSKEVASLANSVHFDAGASGFISKANWVAAPAFQKLRFRLPWHPRLPTCCDSPDFPDCYREVRKLFDWPLQHCPETLFVSMCQLVKQVPRVSVRWGALRTELFQILVPMYFQKKHQNSVALHRALWIDTPEVLQDVLRSLWSKDSSAPGSSMNAGPRIINILQDAQIEPDVFLNQANGVMKPGRSRFAIEIGHLMYTRALAENKVPPLNYPVWLSQQLQTHNTEFMAASIVTFLKARLQQIEHGQTDALSTNMATIYCRVLVEHLYMIQPDTRTDGLGKVISTGRQGTLLENVKQTLDNCQVKLGVQIDQAWYNTAPSAPAPNAPPPITAGGTSGSSSNITPIATATPPQAPAPNVAGGNMTGYPHRNLPPSAGDGPNAPPPGQPPAWWDSVENKEAAAEIIGSSQQAPGTGGPVDVVVGEQHKPWRKEMEEASSLYFSQIYTGQMSVSALVDRMKELATRESGSREYDTYACMIQSLFDECRFFPKYPARELKITGELFGALIRHNLISQVTLGLALRCVLEALRRPPNSKMFHFGLLALEQFLPLLPKWPHLCEHLVKIQPIKSYFPTYTDYFQGILNAVPTEMYQQILDDSQLKDFNFPEVPAHVPWNPEITTADADDAAGMWLGQDVAQQSSNQPQNPMAAAAAASARDGEGITTALGQEGSGSSNQNGINQTPNLQPQQPIVLTPSGGGPPSLQQASGQVDQLLNVLELQKFTEPQEGFPDFVLGILNNLGKFNVEDMTATVAEKMSIDSVGWFCYMFVKHRASKETNMHRIYIQFLDGLDKEKRGLRIMENITNTTYDCLNVLLKSVGQALHSTSHRTVLKNLGAWLGACTLGRNKTLKARALDLKQLLLQACANGHLTAILPMVCNIMEGVATSKVHKLPNPWTTAVMGLLGEIHDLPNLRINLMFEVEVLCKHLGINLPDLHRTSLLQDQVPNNTHDFNQPKTGGSRWPADNVVFNALPPPMAEGAPAFGPPPEIQHGQVMDPGAAFGAGPSIDGGAGSSSRPPPTTQGFDGAQFAAAAAAAAAAPGAVVPASSGVDPRAVAGGGNAPAPRVQLLRDLDRNGFRVEIEHLQQSVLISRSIALFQIQPQLRDLVPTAVHQAIEEIISAVIERSVTISCLTTREVVSKDFAMEPDENMVKKAAQLMVSSLAGSLALVTCREPLRVSLNNHLRSMLTPASAKDSNVQVLIEQVVQIVSADNLDLGCAIVEKAVVDKALKDVEETIAPQITSRVRHRGNSTTNTEAYFDPQYKVQATARANCLPEGLRPSSRPLTAAQLKVYKDFMHAPPQPGPLGEVRQAGGAGGVVGSEFVPGAAAHGQGAPVSVESQANAAALAAAAAATAASAAAAVVGNDVVGQINGRSGSPGPLGGAPMAMSRQAIESMQQRIRPGTQNARLPGMPQPQQAQSGISSSTHPQGLTRARVLEIVNANLKELTNIMARMTPETIEEPAQDKVGVDTSLDAYVLLNTRRDHPLMRCCEDTLKALEACTVAAEVAFVFTSTLLKMVTDRDASRISIEVNLLLLEEVKSIVPEVKTTYAPMLVRGIEEASFTSAHVCAFAGAFRYGFLSAQEVDEAMFKWMSDAHRNFEAANFAINFLDKIIVRYHAGLASDFPLTLDAIHKRLHSRMHEPLVHEEAWSQFTAILLDNLRSVPIVPALERYH